MVTCDGHVCDECAVCLAGECCGDAVVDLSLPAEGTIEHVGTVGVIGRDESGRVQCHMCGLFFDDLASHSRMKHGLSAHEYRSAFGLASGTALCSERLSRVRSMGREGRQFPDVHPMHVLTAEQRSRIASRREARTEVKLKRREAMLSGQARRMSERSRQAMADPAVAGAARRRKIEARRRHKDYTQTCPEGGGTFCRVGNRPRVTCGQVSCVQAARARAASSKPKV